MFKRVADFHNAFGQAVGSAPQLPSSAIRRLRHSLIEEELNEFHEAFDANDAIGLADALADLLYVLAGTAVAYGVAPSGDFASPYDGYPAPRGKDSLIPILLDADFGVYDSAEEADDLAGVSTAIMGMMTDVFAAAWYLQIPINAVFAEVHRSNMSKLDEAGMPVVRADGKILKSSRYEPPDIASVIYPVKHV